VRAARGKIVDTTLLDLSDEAACYARLMQMLRPEGIHCPGCQARKGVHVHRRHRAPVLDYRCTHCGRVFNAWTGTALQGTHRRPTEIVHILCGIVRGTRTAQLARELGCQRAHLLYLRRKLLNEAWLRDLMQCGNGNGNGHANVNGNGRCTTPDANGQPAAFRHGAGA
jgi:transposase-like protein